MHWATVKDEKDLAVDKIMEAYGWSGLQRSFIEGEMEKLEAVGMPLDMAADYVIEGLKKLGL
jgi:hypothetical protein